MKSRSARFTVLLAWNSIAFLSTIVSGFVLSPLVVRGLGIEGYGVWALVFSLLDYLNIADLGIRSATVKYVAHYFTLQDESNLFRTLNASIMYFFGIASALVLFVFFAAEASLRVFHIPPALTSDYVLLLRITGVTMAFQLMFNVPKAALEGVQDFPALSRINICVSVIRTALCLLALHFRLGLAGLGAATAAAIWLGFILIAVTFRRRFPGFVPSFRNFDRTSFGRLLHYGLPTLFGSLASQFLHNGPMLLLGILKDAASVGYYGLVIRLLASLYDVISQTGSITNSVVARLSAENDRVAMERTVTYLNRYSFALFGFVFVFLIVFGRTLFTLWVGAAVAAHCVPLIPWMVVAYAFGSAANQHSVGALFGMAAHRSYNIGLVVEALVLLAGWMIFVPSHSLLFATAWWSISLLLNRGLRTTWLVTRALHLSLPRLLRDIYIRPMIVTVLTSGFAYLMLRSFAPSNWYSLGVVAAVTGLLHLALCFQGVLAPEHRVMLMNFRTLSRQAA